MKLLFILSITIFIFSGYSQEFLYVNKNAVSNTYHSRYLGNVKGKHFILNSNINPFFNESKDIDQDKIEPKPELQLLIFNDQTELEKTTLLDYEYKFQDVLFTGIIEDHISLIYTSRKAKGTVVENYDLDGKRINFDIFSEAKKNNYILSTDSNKFVLHFTEEACYVYNHQLKNQDKFPLETDSVISLVNYRNGFLLLHRKAGELEILQYDHDAKIKRHNVKVSTTWICKDPLLSVDDQNPDIFYLSYIVGKVYGREGGWDFTDTRIDKTFRSKGVDLTIFNGVDNILKDRTILFESNIVYATNPNANSEQNMGCTHLKNKGIRNYQHSLLVLLEEQMMNRKETVNALTGAKKVSHSFAYHDIILIKVDKMTSIQNFLIKAFESNMDENQFGSFCTYIKGDRIHILYNQTYIQERKNKLLDATLDMYLETGNKSLVENFNQYGLNLVLNPVRNYVKSKYFLALQNGFLDLILLQE